jgi:type IV pilus assembly protein PilE
MCTHGSRARGFTLIEMVFVMAIVAILAFIAVTSYQSAMRKARRSEGKTLLQTLMAAEERHYIATNRYTDQIGPDGLNLSVDSQPGRFYSVAKIELSADAQYLLATVTPQDAQQGDPCGGLSLDSLGHRDALGDTGAACW